MVHSLATGVFHSHPLHLICVLQIKDEESNTGRSTLEDLNMTFTSSGSLKSTETNVFVAEGNTLTLSIGLESNVLFKFFDQLLVTRVSVCFTGLNSSVSQYVEMNLVHSGSSIQQSTSRTSYSFVHRPTVTQLILELAPNGCGAVVSGGDLTSGGSWTGLSPFTTWQVQFGMPADATSYITEMKFRLWGTFVGA